MGWCVLILFFAAAEVIADDRGPDCNFTMVAGPATYDKGVKSALEKFGPALRKKECDAARAKGKHKQCVVFKPKDDHETYLSMCDYQKWAGSGNRGEWPAWTATKLFPHKDKPFDLCEAYKIYDECKVVEWQMYPGLSNRSGQWYMKRSGEGEPIMHDKTAPFHEEGYWMMPRQQVVLCCCNESNCNTKARVDAYKGPFPDPKKLRKCRINQSVEDAYPAQPGLGYWRNVTRAWKEKRTETQDHMIQANMASKRCVVYGAGRFSQRSYNLIGKANGVQFWLGRGHMFSGSTLMKPPNRAPLVAPDVCELYGIRGNGCKMVKWQLFPPDNPQQMKFYDAGGDGKTPIFFDETTKYEGFPNVKPVHYPKPDDNYTRDYIPVHDVKLCCCKGKRCATDHFLYNTPIQKPTTTSTTTTSPSTTTGTTPKTTTHPNTTTEETSTTTGESTTTSTKSSTRHSSPTSTATTSSKEATTTTTTIEIKTTTTGADGLKNQWLFVICLIFITYSCG